MYLLSNVFTCLVNVAYVAVTLKTTKYDGKVNEAQLRRADVAFTGARRVLWWLVLIFWEQNTYVLL